LGFLLGSISASDTSRVLARVRINCADERKDCEWGESR
jgi:hypothetical protein